VRNDGRLGRAQEGISPQYARVRARLPSLHDGSCPANGEQFWEHYAREAAWREQLWNLRTSTGD
jgi:hypothetical protein